MLSLGAVDDLDISRSNETPFVMYLEKRNTIGSCPAQRIKYGDVLYGAKAMNMLVRLSKERNERT